LLRRFVGQRDAATFEVLLERYAPLVWGVCRRILHRDMDCEDAFQATFLVLVLQANSIDPCRPLGAWLHTIAVRVSAKALARAQRQRTQSAIPERTTSGDIADELGNRELFRVVDEEIARLPVLFRAPFVLCCLEGRTRDEAAAALGCSVAAVKSRLERSRDVLRRRLERRGFGLPAAFLVLGLTGTQVRASLLAKALQSVLGTASPAVAALLPAAGVSPMSKLALATISFVMVGALGFGAFHAMQAGPPQENPRSAKDTSPRSPQPPVAEKSQPQLDRFGDPLPSGAVRRFGTLRFRSDYWIHDLAFTPDSKQLIAGTAALPLTVIDAATGRRLRIIGQSTGGNHYAFALSPDGKRVSSCVTGALWDFQTGELIRVLNEDGAGQWASVAFSPDGQVVAATREFQAEILIVQTSTGKQLARRIFKPGRGWPPQYSLDAVAFSPDGKYLAAQFIEWSEIKNGVEGKIKQIWLLDAAKGSLVRAIGSDEDAIHSFAFQPGTGRLATIGKDGAIRFWDVNTGNEVHRIAAVRKEEDRGILRFLAGGQQFAVSASTRRKNGSPGTAFLTILDVKDGKELRRIKLGNSTWPIALSPDGRTVATAKFQGESCVRVWDVETGTERLADAGHRAPATLALSADGQTLISRGGEGRVIHWDLQTGIGQDRTDNSKKEDGQPYRTAEAWSLCGPRWQLVLHPKMSEMEVRSRDGSKMLRKVKWPTANMWGALLSPDGTQLAIPLHDDNKNSVLLWDPERENQPRKLAGPPANYHYQKLLFSHDGKRLLIGLGTHNPSPPNALWMWDVETARVVHKLPMRFSPDHLILSSDDRILITGSSWEDPAVHVWDLETGKERARLTDPLLPPLAPGKYEMDRYVAGLCLSADERFLAVVTNRGNSSGISVWEIATWKTVKAFLWNPVQYRPHALIFSSDNRSLFVANGDSTILEWDVSDHVANGRRQPAGETRNRDRLNVLWRTLIETPNQAYPAVWEMLDHRAESVPYLFDRVSPAKPIDERRARRLLGQLNSESFAEREEASRLLLALGEQMLPVLREALQDKPSLETKKRIEVLIESLSHVPSPEQLRLLRALAVLEWSNRPEAVEHLRRLAAGASSARLTEAAKAVTRRLHEKTFGSSGAAGTK
jgi:RNA polymerase sigma factor (sigma-70 family)